MPEDALLVGDLRASLGALRVVLVERLRAAVPGESAPLAKQLADVLVKLDGLPALSKSETDDLADRRANRRASVPEGAGGGVVGGSGSS